MNHDQRAHAILSPSSSKRWMECPASAYWSAVLPPKEDTIYSKWGTECHEYGEKALRLALNDKSPQPIYDKIKEKKQRDLVNDWVDFCVQLYKRVKASADEVPHFYIEERVVFSDDIFGTLDFAIVFKKNGKTYVIGADLKSGAGVKVDISRNTQLMIYLEAFCRTYKITAEAIYIYIFQPQIFDEPQKEKITAEEFSEEIVKIERAEKRALKMITHKPMLQEYNPGDWCKFCPALAECPAVRKASQGVITKALQAEAPQRLAMPDLLAIFEQKSRIEDWLSEIEHHLITKLSKGGKVKGYKLVRGRTNRSWIEDDEKIAAGLKKLGIKDPFTKELITIGEAERKLKEKVPEKLTKKGPGKLTICLESDPREAVKSNSLKLIDEVQTNGREQSKRTKAGDSDNEPKRANKGRTKRGVPAGKAKKGTKKPLGKGVLRTDTKRTNIQGRKR